MLEVRAPDAMFYCCIVRCQIGPAKLRFWAYQESRRGRSTKASQASLHGEGVSHGLHRLSPSLQGA